MTNDLSGFSVASNQKPVVNTKTSDQPTTQKPNNLNGYVGSGAKEQIEGSTLVDLHEKVPIVQVPENEPISPEVSPWIEKLERGEDIQLPQPVTTDDNQTLVSPAQDDVSEDMIILPLSEAQVQKGLHEHIFSGARWLAEWCVRLVKKFHGKVAYRNPDTGGTNGTT